MTETTLHGLLAVAGAERDAVALTDGGARWSYGTLRAHAEARASALRDAGVQSASAVGVWAPPTGDAVLGLLSVMLTGAVAVPLTPSRSIAALRTAASRHELCLVIADEEAAVDFLDLGVPVASARNLHDARPRPSRPGAHAADTAYVLADGEVTWAEWRAAQRAGTGGTRTVQITDPLDRRSAVLAMAGVLGSGGALELRMRETAPGASRPPRAARSEQPAQRPSPHTAAEWALAALEVMRDTLGRPGLTLDDDFFAAGGDSLRATRVTLRLQAAHGRRVALQELYACRTARRLSDLLHAAPAGELLPLPTAAPAQPRAPLTAQQQAMLTFMDQLGEDEPFYELAHAAVVAAPLDLARLEDAAHVVARRHDLLRSRLDGGEWVVDRQPTVRCSVTRATSRQRAALLLRERTLRPYDLSREQPFRLDVVLLPDGETAVAVGTHHLVSDGRSLELLVADLWAAYDASSGPDHVPRRGLQHADYARWQLQARETPSYQRDLQAWAGELAGARPAFRTASTPVVADFEADVTPFTLAPTTVARAERLGAEHGCGLFPVLFAAFSSALARVLRLDETVVATHVANRSAPGTEHLLGYLANAVLIRSAASAPSAFLDHLDQTVGKLLWAYERQTVPVDEALRAAGCTDAYEVLFALQEFESETPWPDWLRSRPLALAPVLRSRRALCVYLTRTEGGAVGTVLRQVRAVPQDVVDHIVTELHRTLDDAGSLSAGRLR